MYEILAKGGPLMIPIGVAGVLALAIFLERVWVLRSERVAPKRLIRAVLSLSREGKISEAGVLCEQDRSGVAQILLAGTRNEGKTRIRIKEFMEETGKIVGADMDRYVNALGTIAAVSPLMGLLGTVTGMITVFQKVTTEGVGDPRILATGIWEALVTTAAGLMIAIPAYIGYRYLMSRVDRLVLEMEESAHNLADILTEENE